MKQTFEFKGNEYSFKDIFYISAVERPRAVYLYEIIFKIIIDKDFYKELIYFDTLEEAEQSRNELIQEWNEVLNESI